MHQLRLFKVYHFPFFLLLFCNRITRSASKSNYIKRLGTILLYSIPRLDAKMLIILFPISGTVLLLLDLSFCKSILQKRTRWIGIICILLRTQKGYISHIAEINGSKTVAATTDSYRLEPRKSIVSKLLTTKEKPTRGKIFISRPIIQRRSTCHYTAP